jgi:glycosyltransferase involved in cell wall biosynthesis
MRIAYIVDMYPFLKFEWLEAEVNSLRSAGLRIKVFSICGTRFGSEATTKLDFPSLFLWLRDRKKFSNQLDEVQIRQMRRAKIDHFHAVGDWGTIASARDLASAMGLSWSFSCDSYDPAKQGFLNQVDIATAKFAVARTASQEIELKRRLIPVVRLEPGPIGAAVDLHRYHFRKWKPKSHLIRIASAGPLDSGSGWQSLLNAVFELRAQERRIGVTWFGWGYDVTEFRRYVRRLNSQIQGTSLGLSGTEGKLIPDFDIVGAPSFFNKSWGSVIKDMRGCHCFILLGSKQLPYDGPISYLALAAALGLPIITTEKGNAEGFIDENSGIILKSGWPSAIRNAIAEVLSDPEKTQRRCQNAREKFDRVFGATPDQFLWLKLLGATVKDK